MGLWVAVDCDLGLTLSHSGGYPGYGSHVLLLPERGAGIFAFANRTYAGPSAPVWDAAVALNNAGFFPDRTLTVSAELTGAYRTVGTIYQRGDVSIAADQLAMNFLMDRDAPGWARDLATLRKQVGDCDTTAPVAATSALSGEFIWRCTHGRLTGSVLLAPTTPPRIQQIVLERKAP